MQPSILFVDDSEVARVATTQRLAGRGLTVTALASSREAADIDSTRFVAALLDIDLGDGFGPDVAAQLRLASPALPIAFLTGGGSPRVLDAARTYGPVFSKTGDVDEAIGWILSVIGF